MTHLQPTDDPSDLASDDAHEVLVAVTGGDAATPPPSHETDPATAGDEQIAAGSAGADLEAANGETVPSTPGEVSSSEEIAERLRGHSSAPSPPDDLPESPT